MTRPVPDETFVEDVVGVAPGAVAQLTATIIPQAKPNTDFACMNNPPIG